MTHSQRIIDGEPSHAVLVVEPPTEDAPAPAVDADVALTVDTTSGAGETVLRVVGELDAATWDTPVDAAQQALAARPPERLVVDLTDVSFLGSSGLGCLVRIRNLCHETGVALTLRGARRPVRKLLVATGLDRSFDVADVSVEPEKESDDHTRT